MTLLQPFLLIPASVFLLFSERRIQCPKCNKHFLKTNHLKKHMNSHEGRRDFVCEKCHKAFLTKYHLTRHLKICKGPKAERTSRKEQDEDDEEGEDDRRRRTKGGDRHVDSSEDCGLDVGGYSSEKSLSPSHWQHYASSDVCYLFELWPLPLQL